MTRGTEKVVREFLDEVRSGRNPGKAAELMAPKVLAHQLTSEKPEIVERSPQNYADHVREMKAVYGDFRLEVTELIFQNDRAYVRWIQTGTHVGELDGFAPTGLELIEFASAVYRVEDGKIIEYWVQIDRAGLRSQLERNATAGGAT
jgi:predicted ester cyclase